ncbi:MAG: hypothetical protein HWN81_08400 [Candidatus Lokiarchaeota archaeon]|nr:hypothetical protein [Candidatus Lokiarchaeota archaeon]
MVSKKFRCPYCKSTIAYNYYRHMRAFSKVTNIFIKCLNCGRFLSRDNF